MLRRHCRCLAPPLPLPAAAAAVAGPHCGCRRRCSAAPAARQATAAAAGPGRKLASRTARCCCSSYSRCCWHTAAAAAAAAAGHWCQRQLRSCSWHMPRCPKPLQRRCLQQYGCVKRVSADKQSDVPREGTAEIGGWRHRLAAPPWRRRAAGSKPGARGALDRCSYTSPSSHRCNGGRGGHGVRHGHPPSRAGACSRWRCKRAPARRPLIAITGTKLGKAAGFVS